ncbi:MAG: MBL fold metallo-hydrolase [Clostridia bacterium]|nr:MBL fold metallo-hydrolase [Clostridia bacterium]
MKIKILSLGALQTNCYIFGNDGKCAVIDPAACAAEIHSAAQEMGMTIEKILLTHSHFDHFEALEELYNMTGAQVMVSVHDSSGLKNPQLNLSSSFGFTPLTFNDKVTEIAEGDIISVGNKNLTVMSTPGHTPGSVCFISEENKIIFSGDTVFCGSIGRTDFPGGNFDAIIDSLKRVLTLDGNYKIFPGHGCSTTVETEQRSNPYYRQNSY